MTFSQMQNIGFFNIGGPKQSLSATLGMKPDICTNNVFGVNMLDSLPVCNLSGPPMYMNPAIDFFNNNQAEFQQLFFQTLMQIYSNPLINHTPSADIMANFRPYDYNKYDLPESPSFNFDFNTYLPSSKSVSNSNKTIAAEASKAVSSAVNSYGSNSKKIAQLHPEMQEKTMQLLDYAKSKGLKIQITSGYRTPEEQQELLRTRPKFAAKRSAHCAGKAIDINIIGGTDADYKMLGDYAKSIGMRWGGDFSSVKERWHFDYQWG